MKNYIVSVLGFGLSLYVYFASKVFERAGDGLAGDPAYYPRVLAYLLAFMSIVLLIDTLRKKVAIKINVNRELLINICKFMGLVIIYALILKPVGFLFSTAAFTAIMILLLGGSKKQVGIYPLPISIITYVLFSFILRVPLPKGLLSFL